MQTIQQLLSGELIGTKHLKLSSNLTEFPLEILDLHETLEILDLSQNKLSNLPANFDKLSKLKIAFFSDNLFTELPDVLGKCQSLEMIGFKSNQIKTVSENSLPIITRWLILTNNQIEEIPKSLGSCYRLQKLALAGNKIKELPAEMVNCQNVELIRISANLLTNFPSWLLQLPKLSWVAFAGNPFSEMAQIPNHLNQIEWADLTLNEQLGQGASGIIYKSTLKGFDKDVAVKIFKGEITSDGLPLNEMNASMAAGNHSNLVNVLGKIINHPEQKEGLVMSLIPENYKNLGNPPSLDSCSRDVFNVGTNFTLNQILNIASGTASVCKQLHSLGIIHGDLYAHNIMFDEEGNHLLGDFGAATFYNTNSNIAEALQKIEVRAYGCLLDDMLLNSTEDIQHPTIKFLTQLRDNCLQSNILKRPLFSEIMLFLESNTF
ncbi:MAG: leucine-rich repeat-containing protein kinase family protein [Candidatus Methylacidiphilales bacterium]